MHFSSRRGLARNACKAGVRAVITGAMLFAVTLHATAEKSTTIQADADGRLRLVISLSEQKVDVYRGTELLDTAPVSTGKKGLDTPAGVYSILQKRKFHRSNIYSAAPMPFMQRITWSGIALHAGRLPGYPASHGCIRMPAKFAKKLFSMTEVGADVIVTQGKSELQLIDHPALFQPQTLKPLTAVAVNITGISDAPVSSYFWGDLEYDLDRITSQRRLSTSPLRILVTRRTGRERMLDVQNLLAELGHDPGDVDGYLGPDTGRAIQAFQRSKDQTPTGMFTDNLVAALYQAVGRVEPTGHLYVRQDYVDIYDAPVVLIAPEHPLGTHMFTSSQFEAGAEKAIWTTLKVDSKSGTQALDALTRIHIPAKVRTRVSEMLTPNSSLVISDAGLGKETGKGTDFIVQP